MNEKLTELVRVIGSHGTEEQAYFIAVASEAALRLLNDNPDRFASLFGTLGAEIIRDFKG